MEGALCLESSPAAASPPPSGQPRPSPCRRSPFKQKQRVRCVFCLGATCNRCGANAYLQLDSPALDKVHSSWITESIVAMQRPSDALIESAQLLDQFDRLGIGAVFNLTEPGEHPYCGHGVLEATGFPYSPEKLMARGVHHFNYSWPDMTTPSLAVMEDIVQVAGHQLAEGRKLAVHCHAGYGRTGLAIACILVAKQGMTAEEAIALVRAQRPGSVQTAKQVAFVVAFAASWARAVQVFPPAGVCPPDQEGKAEAAAAAAAAPSSKEKEERKTFAQSLRDQQLLLSTAELAARRLRWTSRLLLRVHDDLFCAGQAQDRDQDQDQAFFLASCLSGLGANVDAIDPVQYSAPTPEADTDAAVSVVRADLSLGRWASFDTALAQAVSGGGGGSSSQARTSARVCVRLALEWLGSRADCLLDAAAVEALGRALLPASADGSGGASANATPTAIDGSGSPIKMRQSLPFALASPGTPATAAAAAALAMSPLAAQLSAAAAQSLCRARHAQLLLLGALLGRLSARGVSDSALSLAALRLAVACFEPQRHAWALGPEPEGGGEGSAAPTAAPAESIGAGRALCWARVKGCCAELALPGGAALTVEQQELCLAARVLLALSGAVAVSAASGASLASP